MISTSAGRTASNSPLAMLALILFGVFPAALAIKGDGDGYAFFRPALACPRFDQLYGNSSVLAIKEDGDGYALAGFGEEPEAADATVAGSRILAMSTCPHPNFVLKHLCQYCADDDEALNFSRERRVGHFQTGVNSVVFGRPGYREEDGRCVSDKVKVVKCNLNTGYCNLEGEQCVTYHDSGNGHLYYRDTDCD